MQEGKAHTYEKHVRDLLAEVEKELQFPDQMTDKDRLWIETHHAWYRVDYVAGKLVAADPPKTFIQQLMKRIRKAVMK